MAADYRDDKRCEKCGVTMHDTVTCLWGSAVTRPSVGSIPTVTNTFATTMTTATMRTVTMKTRSCSKKIDSVD